MNEVGLDPGVDHMLAMQCIDEVHNKGGKVSSCVCVCGGGEGGIMWHNHTTWSTATIGE